MDIVKSAADGVRDVPIAHLERPDGGAQQPLIARLAAWCTSGLRAQDRDPTLWMHRDLTT